MQKPFDYTHADDSGVNLGFYWGVIQDGVLTNVVEEYIVPSVANRIFQESKTKPDTLYVLGRFFSKNMNVEQAFMHNEVWHLVQNGKIAVVGLNTIPNYSPSLGLPEKEHWIKMPERKKAYKKYAKQMKF